MGPGERPLLSRRAQRDRAEPGVDPTGSADVSRTLGGTVETIPAPPPQTVATVVEAEADERAEPAVPDVPAADPGALDIPPTDVGETAPPATEAAAPATPIALAAAASTASTTHRTALLWTDASTVVRPKPAPVDLGAASSSYIPVEPDLLGRAPRRSPLRPGVLVPTAILAALAATYSAGALLWPLHEVPPTIEATTVDPVPAPAAAPAFPGVGSASVSIAGIPGALASTEDPQVIASITKVVTALAVLEEMPLNLGEPGPNYRFDYSDSDAYWAYRVNNESALDVPVDGTLSQYQLLQGMLIGSANNYADRLAYTIWPSDRVFADAANGWLESHGVAGVHVTDPSGIDYGNTATPAGLLVLAQKALANPVIAEIVRTPAVDIPGAGHVVNTNGLLADPGVVGVKTGSLDSYNVLLAKDVPIGDTTVRIYASVLGQPDDATRSAAARALFAQTEAELQPVPSVTAGTTVAHVETPWGERVAIDTASDADVILWNGGHGTVSTTFDLGDEREQGARVGSLTVAGPLNTTSVELRLAEEVEGPTAWWRLTHPLELLGLVD